MNDPERIDPLALIGKFAEQEKQLAEKPFLAPVTVGGKVRVSIDGAIYDLALDDRRFEGWGIFRMSSPGRAVLVENASPSLISEYLKLLPRKQFVLIDQFDGRWFALTASTSDTRFALDGPVPIQLVDSLRGGSFDTVNARFDGNAFWYEAIDRRRDPAVAREMRKSLETKTDPDKIHVHGMTPQELLVYRINYLRRYQTELPVDDRTRIAEALRHADATLETFSYADHDQGVAHVRFVLDGQTHVVQIRAGDMSVVSAGICLSGKDRDFDLTSLVGVFREARQRWGGEWGENW